MDCGSDKKKYKCDGRHSAACTFYEKDLPKDSELKEESCVTTEETTSELYKWVSELRNSLDKSKIKGDCIEFDKDKQEIVDLLNLIIEKLCDTQDKGDSSDNGSEGGKPINIFDMSIEGIDTSCLTSECNDSISSLGELIQELVYKNCK